MRGKKKSPPKTGQHPTTAKMMLSRSSGVGWGWHSIHSSLRCWSHSLLAKLIQTTQRNAKAKPKRLQTVADALVKGEEFTALRIN